MTSLLDELEELVRQRQEQENAALEPVPHRTEEEALQAQIADYEAQTDAEPFDGLE
jgi:hypothetical protein